MIDPGSSEGRIYPRLRESQEESEQERNDRNVQKCCCIFLLLSFVIGFVILIVIITSNREGGGGGAGYYGGYYGGGGRYGGGRGGGGRGGCFSEFSYVWTKNETQSDEYAQLVMVENLKEGSLVATLDTSRNVDEDYKFTWTRATDVTVAEGNWIAHILKFSNGRKLTVTSPHLMIVKRKGQLYFLRADNVQRGDEMIVNKVKANILSITRTGIKKKVAVETEDGTIEVNGVLASGLCDNNPDTIDKITKFESYREQYKLNHFGNDFNYKCMDEVAWKKNYLINNDIS